MYVDSEKWGRLEEVGAGAKQEQKLEEVTFVSDETEHRVGIAGKSSRRARGAMCFRNLIPLNLSLARQEDRRAHRG